MTPKEKAYELVEKYLDIDWWITDGYDMEDWLEDYTENECIEFALIAVDEILEVIIGTYDFDSLNKYWTKVRQEIKKYDGYISKRPNQMG